ncbi:hypothetical protein FB45DRAFT_1031584 [Roridomyces roridus]|uniref:F-box domain-containing protein n=1 Tax=Roridomyces roridus TaxID=1738132 RepID=A0AAD7BKH9_9AGAR|nr:hypothetical protein FB45DRAFT_1031584 [Roridomyces roridus]
MAAVLTTPTALTFPSDLVPELHALILSNLPYLNLLCAKRVAKKWKAIVESDPTLQVQTFKKATSEYRDNGVKEKWSTQKEPIEPVTMHPALQDATFMFGQPIRNMILYDAPVASAGVLDDLAIIPAVHTFEISWNMDEDEWVKKHDMEDQDNYEGLDGLKRTGTKLVGDIVLLG